MVTYLFKAGAETSLGRNALKFIAQALLGSTLIGMGVGFFSKSNKTMDKMMRQVPRPQGTITVPASPDEGGPREAHIHVSTQD